MRDGTDTAFRGWERAFFLSGVLLSITGLVWFLLGDVGGYEISMLRWLESIRSPLIDAVMIAVTTMGNSTVIVPLVVIFSVLLLLLKRYELSGKFVIFSTSMFLLNLFLKLLFARERPDDITSLVEAPGYGFPSGHSMVSTSIYGFIILVLAGRYRGHSSLLLTAWILFAVLICVSRLWMGVHYPSDVIFGMGLGLCTFPVIVRLVRNGGKRADR